MHTQRLSFLLAFLYPQHTDVLALQNSRLQLCPSHSYYVRERTIFIVIRPLESLMIMHMYVLAPFFFL